MRMGRWEEMKGNRRRKDFGGEWLDEDLWQKRGELA